MKSRVRTRKHGSVRGREANASLLLDPSEQSERKETRKQRNGPDNRGFSEHFEAVLPCYLSLAALAGPKMPLRVISQRALQVVLDLKLIQFAAHLGRVGIKQRV